MAGQKGLELALKEPVGGSAPVFLREKAFFTGELFSWFLPKGRENKCLAIRCHVPKPVVLE